MQFKILLFFASVTLLLACQDKRYGLNPVANNTYHFLMQQRIVVHLSDRENIQTLRLNFSLRSLPKEDSSNKFLFTISGLQLDPVPTYLSEVVNFQSLQRTLASNPYEIM